MSKKQSTPATEPAKKPAAELSERELNQASGGAVDMFVPTDSFRAEKSAIGDGSVKINIGLVKKP